MKKFLPLLICGLLFCAACGNKNAENTDNTPETPAVDSLIVEEDAPIVVPSVHDFFFTDFIPNTLSLDYEEIPFGQEDYKAYIPTANEVFYAQYKRKKSTRTSHGSGIKPVITVQTFTFNSQEEVEPGLLQWLKSFDGGENLEAMGEGTRALKIPPFLVIADGVDVSVIGTKCEHVGKEWNTIKTDFLQGKDKITHPELAWVFEIECGGPLIYTMDLQVTGSEELVN